VRRWLAYCRIARLAGERSRSQGLNVTEMLSARLKAYVLVGGIESADLAPSSAV
jgi:hypothetical protein